MPNIIETSGYIETENGDLIEIKDKKAREYRATIEKEGNDFVVVQGKFVPPGEENQDVTRSDIESLNSQIVNLQNQINKAGISEYLKVALLDVFSHVAYTDENGIEYYRQLKRALDGKASTDPIDVEGIYLDEVSGTYYVGDEFVIIANVTPVNATNKAINWSTTDNTVATVSDGIVNVLKSGNCQIKATTVDGGFEAIYELTSKPERIFKSIDKNDFVYFNNDKTSFSPTNVPVTAYDESENKLGTIEGVGIAYSNTIFENNANVTIKLTNDSITYRKVYAGSFDVETKTLYNSIVVNNSTAYFSPGDYEFSVNVKRGQRLAIHQLNGFQHITSIEATWEE